jgi:hypothetical protein
MGATEVASKLKRGLARAKSLDGEMAERDANGRRILG